MPTMMFGSGYINLWAPVLLLLVFSIYWVIRPRVGGKDAPPCVLSSPIVKIPFLGTAFEFGISPVKMVQRCFDEYGPIFTIPILSKRITMLVSPEAQELFFKASDDVLSQNEVYDFMKPIFGGGVIYDATRKNRHVQFQSMAHGLRASLLRSHVPKIEYETREYLKEHWNGESGEVDLLKSLSEITILAASRCLHGDDVREEIFEDVATLFHDLDKGLLPISVFWPTAPIKAHKKRDEARKQMVELFAKVIKQRRADPRRTNGTDVLQILLDMKYKDGTQATDDQVTGLLIALLFAGQHTSCITSTWTALFSTDQPKVMERILVEQEKVLGVSGNGRSVPLDYDKVSEMTFLHDCMREALRLCPPLILLMRKAMKDIRIKVEGKNMVIPRGDMVGVSPSVAMRIPAVFPDPGRFDPDRYGPGREEDKIPYAYLGFGGGMHSCMGQNFAFLQIKTILSIIFREYEIERISPKIPDIDFGQIVVGPKGSCHIRYKKRFPTSN